MPHPTFGTAQLLILSAVAASSPGPFDLRQLQRGARLEPAVSRAVRRLVDCGELQWLRLSPGCGFLPAGGWERQVRYVRRARI